MTIKDKIDFRKNISIKTICLQTKCKQLFFIENIFSILKSIFEKLKLNIETLFFYCYFNTITYNQNYISNSCTIKKKVFILENSLNFKERKKPTFIIF